MSKHIFDGGRNKLFSEERAEAVAIPGEAVKVVQPALAAEIDRLRAELKVSDALIQERDRLLDAIPPCPDHGACVPHAIEWVEAAKRLNAVNAELVAALQGVLPYMEAAENAGLVGDEGCHWPVESVRAALAKAKP